MGTLPSLAWFRDPRYWLKLIASQQQTLANDFLCISLIICKRGPLLMLLVSDSSQSI